MLPTEYNPEAIKDYHEQIDRHALYGTLRKHGCDDSIIQALKTEIHSKARSCPRDERSVKQLLTLEKKLTNLIYSLYLDRVIVIPMYFKKE